MTDPWLDDGDLRLFHGDALTVLRSLPAGIAQTCITSPPYWGLRDYGTGQWTGGDEACDHLGPLMRTKANLRESVHSTRGGANHVDREPMGSTCSKCGAQRVDSQLGLEPTPTEYVENMVNLFREVRRVLRDDGTLWLNLGDSYNSSSQFNHDKTGLDSAIRYSEGDGQTWPGHRALVPGLKPKDLVGIPWRVAFALQADGWYLRSDIIWSKPNPMPESVVDRPTKAHEYVFLFSKQPRYFYDADAIREPHSPLSHSTDNSGGFSNKATLKSRIHEQAHAPSAHNGHAHPAGRNRRSVWTIPTEPFPEAHFATYPQELVRPCILAGTSERGECVECGAPWRRIVVETDEYAAWKAREKGWASNPDAVVRGTLGSGRNSKTVPAMHVTTGWEPSCSCAATSRAQLVLDPFIGSGTTALVARKHGRRCIGIDLSLEYLAIAAKRTQQLSLLGVAP